MDNKNDNSDNNKVVINNSDVEFSFNQTKKTDNSPYIALLGVTIFSVFLYAVLFYLFINKKLKVETLLIIITFKFVLTTIWTYWSRFKSRRK